MVNGGRYERREEATRFLTVAVALRPNDSMAWVNLGEAFNQQENYSEAERSYHQALRIKPDNIHAYYSHGNSLKQQWKHADAEKSYREAIRISPNESFFYSVLGNVLQEQHKFVEAERAYREAILIYSDDPEVHCNLGRSLLSQSRFAEALVEFSSSLEIKQRIFKPAAADDLERITRLIRLCEVLVAAEKKNQLPSLIRGDIKPKDNDDRLILAQLWYDTKRFAAAARFWSDAMVENLQRRYYGYQVAGSAALAGTGQGKDDPIPDEAGRIKLRKTALDWLRSELKFDNEIYTSNGNRYGPQLANKLAHWKQDPDLAGVRDEKELAKLPEAERKDWQALWADVDSLLAKVAKP